METLRFYLAILLSLSLFTTAGQQNVKADIKETRLSGVPVDLVLGGSLLKGFFVPHRAHLVHLQQNHSTGFDVYFDWNRRKQNYWDALYLNPKLGINLNYTDLGNKEQLGYHLGLVAQMKMPLKLKMNFKPILITGMGLGYNSKIWDINDNVRSTALGSKLNINIRAGFAMEYIINEKLSMNAGIKLDHFSNGSYKQPNNGTNVVALFVDFNLHKRRGLLTEWTQSRLLLLKPRTGWDFSMAYGVKETSIENTQKYSVYVLKTLYNFKETSRGLFGVGGDVFFNTSLNYLIEGRDDFSNMKNNTQLGLVASYSIKFDKIAFMYNQGVYIYNEKKDLGLLYSRFGLKCYFENGFYVSPSLKSHWAKADHAELTIGYILQ